MIDSSLMISEDKALTSTGASSDTLDLGLEGYAKGDPVRLKCLVTTKFTSGGAGTLAITVASSAESGGDYTTHFSLGATGKASLTAGAVLIDMVLPKATDRWIKVTYTVGEAAMTAGKVTTYIDTD